LTIVVSSSSSDAFTTGRRSPFEVTKFVRPVRHDEHVITHDEAHERLGRGS